MQQDLGKHRFVLSCNAASLNYFAHKGIKTSVLKKEALPSYSAMLFLMANHFKVHGQPARTGISKLPKVMDN